MKASKLAFTFILIAAASRLFLLSDMEFKADERATVEILQNLFSVPYSPLAPISQHSGIAHSSGFFYFLKLISFASDAPLIIAGSIAFFAFLTIAISLWFLRHSTKYLLWLAMVSSSLALFLGTRKIWTPDLVAPWVIAGIGGFGIAESIGKHKARLFLLGLSGFCLVIAPHMYLSSAPAAVIATVTVAAVLFAKQDKPGFKAWLSGCGVAWLTFVPYAYLMISGAQGSTAQGEFAPGYTVTNLFKTLSALLTVPTPFNVHASYLRPFIASIDWQGGGHLLNFTLFWLFATALVWLGLFLASILIAAKNWRNALRDPILVTSFAVWLGTGAAIYVTRLGAWLNYWFGVLPFVYYIIAWACTEDERARNSRPSKLRRFLPKIAWLGSALSFILIIHFVLLVHKLDGLPGEYGPTYGSQKKSGQFRQ